MARKLQTTLEKSGIEWPALRNHIPCMVHIIQLALGAFMSSLGVKSRTKSWDAHERDQQFGENECTDIGKSQRLRIEGNDWINKVSAMRPGLAKIIEKVRISTYFESAETDFHIAENACWIDYTDTWSSKRVHWLSNSQSPDRSTTHYRCKDSLELHTVVAWAITNYVNAHASSLTTQNTAITSHSSQHRMSGLLWSMAWRFYGHSVTVPCGCRNRIPLLCITSSLSTMTCLITWMVWCELAPSRRHNGRNTYSLPWSLHCRSCPNIILKWLQQLVCFSFRHISWILSESCDRIGSGTREWILILKTRLRILSNTRRPLYIRWRTNSASNIDGSRSSNPKAYRTTISCSPHWLLGLFNLHMIHMICLAMMKNIQCLTMWPKRLLEEVIMPHAYWQPQGSISIHLLNCHRTGCKLIWILMITTPTQWRLVVHFGYRISPTGCGSKKKHTQSTLISPMWHATYSLSYLTVSELRPACPLGEMWSGGGSQKPQARRFVKRS